MTEKEFILRHIAYERGLIQAYRSMANLCNVCVKAHKAELTRKRIKELTGMNSHLTRKK